MENKNLILAIAVSCVIFLAWNFLSVQLGWVPEPVQQNATVAQKEPDASPAAPANAAALVGEVALGATDAAAPVSEDMAIQVKTPLYETTFMRQGGIMTRLELVQYRKSLRSDSPQVALISDYAATRGPFSLMINGMPSWKTTEWTLEGGDLNLTAGQSGTLTFSGEIDGIRVKRLLTFHGDKYTIDEKTVLASDKNRVVNVAYTFAATSLAIEDNPSIISRLRHLFFGGEEPAPQESQYNFTRVAWLENDKFSEDMDKADLAEGILLKGKVSWVSVMNNYFMGAVSMADANSVGKAGMAGNAYQALIGKTNIIVEPQQETATECTYFVGPKDVRVLSQAPNNIEKALDYGFFSIIAKPLVLLLGFLYGYVGNYGVAIILMTIIIKIIFWPLSQKSYKSMNGLKKIQPLMAELRDKYKDDKETLNKEMMALYKRHKVNPAGGCLPILVQIPVFFGLYQALLNAIELRHAVFLPFLPFTEIPWLQDLAAADPFCITPLIMGATMFLQQKMTPAPGDPTQAKIMMFMPLIFTVLFLGFPAGLVLYWLTNNVISIGQQWGQLRNSS